MKFVKKKIFFLKTIKNNKYNFFFKKKIGNHEYKKVDDTPCKFALAPEGAKHFHQLSKEEKTGFLSELRQELINIIPAKSELLGEIKVSGETEIEAFFKITINSVTDTNVRNVDSLISDLDTMIREKKFTGISRSDTAKYLDPDFGFQRYGKYN